MSIISAIYESENGYKLEYKLQGNLLGKPVVFFHGFGSSYSLVEYDLHLLNHYNFYIISINRPGYGRSSLLKRYTLSEFIYVVRELLQFLQIKKVDLIGWSAGGLYAQVFKKLCPDYVNSLSLISSAVPFNTGSAKAVLPFQWRFIRFINMHMSPLARFYFKRISKSLEKNKEKTIDKAIAAMEPEDKKILSSPLFRDNLIKSTEEAYDNDGLAVYYDALAMMENISIDYDNDAKIYIWQGNKDDIWPEKTTLYFKKIYKQSQYMLVENEGHLLIQSKMKDILDKIN